MTYTWFDAQLYVIRTERTRRPDVEIHFRGLRNDLAEQALAGMAQALADTIHAGPRPHCDAHQSTADHFTVRG